MSEFVFLLTGVALGYFVGVWDERHPLTWRGRWENFIHHFGKHIVSEYSGRCIICDEQIGQPAKTNPVAHLFRPPDA